MRTRAGHIAREILAHNAGRDPQRLRVKLQQLRQDPFAFFRGSNHLFLKFLPRSHALFRAPNALVCGDLHLENFGTYKGDNRLCYFDIDDFDEACLAPPTVDIIRFLTSLDLAAAVLGLDRAEAGILVRSFLGGYRAAILAGKPRWIERAIADGAVRTLLRRVMRRTRASLLNRYTRLRRKQRRLRPGGRMLAANDADRKALLRLCKRLALQERKPSFFRLLDAAVRVAGNASLGLPRFLLLVQGRGSPGGNFLLDLKLADGSATAKWSKVAQPRWANEAERIVTLQGIAQAIAPAMLGAVRFGKRAFVLKEMQPSLDRLDLPRQSAKIRKMRRVIQTMGQVTAWAHLRGCGRLGAAPVQAMQTFVATKRWEAQAGELAKITAKKFRRAWMSYCADYDAGRLGEAQGEVMGA